MDYFDPFAEVPDLSAVVSAATRFCVLSFDSDWRFDTSHSRRIATRLEQAGCPTTFREIHSPWGHDSFLLAIPAYHDTVRAFLEPAGEVRR